MFLNIAAALAGVLLIGIALRDVFQAVVVPRAMNRRLRVSALTTSVLWKMWPALAYRFYRNANSREDFFAIFAPFSMILLLVAWVVILIVGYGLVFYSIRLHLSPQPVSFGTAVYYAGASLLTIGYGDVVARTELGRFVSLAAGASGLGVVAVVTSYLFAVFGAFRQREAFVVTTGSRAGTPPSGVGLLEMHATGEMRADLASVFRDGQRWAADVMESHLAYPVLGFFRSSHDYESWVATLGTLLDASTLMISTVDDTPAGQARIMYDVGGHCARDLAKYYGLASEPSVGIDRVEFEAACDRLSKAGLFLRDRDRAWIEFARLRSTYAGQLNAMARSLEIPPVQWVGDRSLINVH